MTGRPSDYTEELANTICEYLADGMSLKKICEKKEMPSKATVYNWLSHNQIFLDKYTRAREDQADTLADEICDIADDGSRDTYKDENGKTVTDHDVIARSRLRVEARKWVAAKLKPKKYGDKVQTDVQNLGKDGLPADAAPMNVYINGVSSDVKRTD
jgi:predicted DNA-binding protein YlxM (UPF0122 family)